MGPGAAAWVWGRWQAPPPLDEPDWSVRELLRFLEAVPVAVPKSKRFPPGNGQDVPPVAMMKDGSTQRSGRDHMDQESRHQCWFEIGWLVRKTRQDNATAAAPTAAAPA